jgi:hypothetical protein
MSAKLWSAAALTPLSHSSICRQIEEWESGVKAAALQRLPPIKSVLLLPSFPESKTKQRGSPLIHLRAPAAEIAGARCLFEPWAIGHERAVQNDKPCGEEAGVHFLCCRVAMESIMYRANRRPFNSDGAISLTIKFASLNSIEIWEPRLCSTNRASYPTPCISTPLSPDCEGGSSASFFAAAAIEGVIRMTA